MLMCSVAVAAISSTSGNAQSVGFEGSVTSQGKFGAVVNGFLPLGNFTGMPFLMLQGGMYKDEPVGSLGGGYRWLTDNMMFGGFVSGDLQGAKGSKILGGLTLGGEFFIGRFGLQTNVYVPIKRKRVLQNTASGEGVFEDRTTGGSCTATSANCRLVIVGQKDSRQIAPLGADMKVSYQLVFGTSFEIVPYVGGYVFQNKLVGLQTGADIAIVVGNGFAITGGAKMTHDRRRTEAVFTAGITFQFGGDTGNSSTYLQRRMSQMPDRLQPGMLTETRRGQSVRQAAYLEGHVGNVRIVNAANQNDADNIVGAIGNNGLVIFDGAVTAQNAQTIAINHNGVAIIGGDQTLRLRGADGYQYTAKVSGTRGSISQADNMTDIFSANGRQDLFFAGFDITGGQHGIHVVQSPRTHIKDVTGINIGTDAFRLDESANSRLEDVFANNAGGYGLHIRNKSHNTVITNSRSVSAGQDGLFISSSDRVKVEGFDSIDSTANGVNLNNAKNNELSNIRVTNATDGLLLGMGTEKTMVDGLTVVGVNRGVVIDRATGSRLVNLNITAEDFGIRMSMADDTHITNSRLNVKAGMNEAGIRIVMTEDVVLDTVTITGTNATDSTGIVLVGGGRAGATVKFKNVLVQGYDFGYAFDTGSAVTDQGNNRATNITMANNTCDNTNDVDEGSVSVLNTNDSMVRTCN